MDRRERGGGAECVCGVICHMGANTKLLLLLFLDPHVTSRDVWAHTLWKVKGPRGTNAVCMFANNQRGNWTALLEGILPWRLWVPFVHVHLTQERIHALGLWRPQTPGMTWASCATAAFCDLFVRELWQCLDLSSFLEERLLLSDKTEPVSFSLRKSIRANASTTQLRGGEKVKEQSAEHSESPAVPQLTCEVLHKVR